MYTLFLVNESFLVIILYKFELNKKHYRFCLQKLLL